jgi:hypothetical protein
MAVADHYVIGHGANVVRIDFGRKPDEIWRCHAFRYPSQR